MICIFELHQREDSDPRREAKRKRGTKFYDTIDRSIEPTPEGVDGDKVLIVEERRLKEG